MVVSFTPFNLLHEFSSIAEAIVEFSQERDLSALGPEYCTPFTPRYVGFVIHDDVFTQPCAV